MNEERLGPYNTVPGKGGDFYVFRSGAIQWNGKDGKTSSAVSMSVGDVIIRMGDGSSKGLPDDNSLQQEDIKALPSGVRIPTQSLDVLHLLLSEVREAVERAERAARPSAEQQFSEVEDRLDALEGGD